MTQPTEASASPPNRMPVILGAGLAVVLLVFLLTRLAGGGDDAVDDSTTPTTAVRRAPSTTTTTVAGGQPVETFEVFTSKNPFLRLRGGGPATGTATGGTTTGGTGTSTGGTSTGGTSTGGTSTGGTTTGGTATGTRTGGTTTGGTATGGTGGTGSTSGTGGSTSPRRSDRVTLLDVFVEGGRVVANVRVNDTVHKVGAGDTFATSYKVLSLSQGSECGRFAFGDDTFQLCRGEQALK